ncbi:hypothetical protein yc1106_02571 [Curvularia clavata]|uniref:Uncharacterized protein n=1 Tax=Curvularia clavata TaxID=95742 RepID=A0A9Q8Z314_CURCL|nr:hypothetical protein yc1106_02571 [Curvularia clavata]
MASKFYLHVQLHSRYNVLDASGRLPFSVVFGLCRLAKSDTDPRPILIETAGSVFDVPYALAHGLLTLYEERLEDATKWTEIDLSRMGEVEKSISNCISVPSPVGRTRNWKGDLTVYLGYIDLKGMLASVLKAGKRYRIRLASKDLCVKKWAYGDREQFTADRGEAAKPVNSYSHGHATFKVLESLSFPPRADTKLRLVQGTSLEVTVENTGEETITVQPRGHQGFLTPWGPMEPEPDMLDDRPRIIDSLLQNQAPISSLVVLDAATRKVVRGHEDPSKCHLRDSKADLRPKVDELIVLEPHTPITIVHQMDWKIRGLPDGVYKIRMHPKGCRWWFGKLVNKEGEDGRVPARLWKSDTVPFMLESQDELEVNIQNGKINGTL